MSTVGKMGSDLAGRVAAAERGMRSLAGRASRSSWLALLLGAAVLAGLSAYFWYGYSKLEEFLQPEEIVTTAQGLLDSNIPLAREQLQTEVKNSAPELAKSLSDQLKTSLPQARIWLAEAVVGQIQEGLDQTSLISLEQLRAFLRDNKDLIERDLTMLSGSEKLADAELEEMVKLLEAQFGEDFRQRAFTLYETANGIQEQLDRLAAGSQLSERELSMRRLLTYVRRLQTEATGDRALPEPRTIQPRLNPAPAAGDAAGRTEPDAQPATAGAAAPAGDPPQS